MSDKDNTQQKQDTNKDTDHELVKKYKDPVCGMETEEKGKFDSYQHDGEVYYFCSDHCLKKFKEEPESYISGDKAASPDESDEETEDQAATRQYTCPMHPEVEQKGPGTCPICGMAHLKEVRWLMNTMNLTLTHHFMIAFVD